MLSYFNKLVNWAKKNLNDILLTAGVVLMALAGFGAGQLFSFFPNNQPIIIQQPAVSPVDFVNFVNSANSSALTQPSAVKSEEEPTAQKMLVGSINSNKYHWPDCPSAKKIAPQNQIWFNSEDEAKKAGYVACGNFRKYQPAGY